MAPVEGEVTIRPAEAEDIDAVLDVLSEAARWVKSLGIDQWPERFPRRLVRDALDRAEVFVANGGGDVVGTLMLQWRDPLFWGDRDDAGFVHRLAIRRSHAGVGRSLLEWAEQRAVEQGRAFLCVDCMTENLSLRRYYESLGFVEVGEIEGTTSHPHGATTQLTWRATLYERPVARRP
jgi:GNAT superfamily N-acetyltransferase